MFQPQATPFAPFAYSPLNTNSVDGEFLVQPAGFSIVNGGGPISIHQPIFTGVGPYGHLQPHQHHNLPHRYPTIMDQTENIVQDISAQEALARDYMPELKGPLVGNKKPSHAITEEYAKADPVYVRKTARLPLTFSHFREIAGDGNCGWRAIGFSYFEALAKMANEDMLDIEYGRMMSFPDFIEQHTGITEWVFEGMRDEVMELLADIKSSLSHGPQQVASLLLQRFNDSAVSDNILYYFRLLTSAHLRAHAATYVHFIPDGLDLNSYAKEVLEPSRSEIDHVGMQLLIDVLIRPIGLPVTVIYLDRSEGDDVTPHVLQGDASGNISMVKPEAYLLYRPGHYDILYKEEDAALTGMAQRVVAGAAQASQLQIHRASIASRLEQEAPIGIGNTYDMSALSLIPGMSLAQPLSSHIFNQFSVQDSFDPMPVKFDPSPIGFNPTPIEYETKPIKYDPGVSYPIGIPMDLDTHVTAPSLSDLSSTSSIRAMTPHSATVPPMSQPFHPAAPPPTKAVKSQSLPENPVIPGSQFRPSKYEYEPDLKESIATVQQNLKTSMFKNSHYNTSHWMNPHFQPEEWTPDQEEYPLPQQRRGSKGGRGSFSK